LDKLENLTKKVENDPDSWTWGVDYLIGLGKAPSVETCMGDSESSFTHVKCGNLD
jgi:hypothetical protein